MSVNVEATALACARDLFEARKNNRAIAPVRNRLPAKDVAAAYRVQQINVDKLRQAGRRSVGRKIGLTSEAVQKQLGVAQPDFGVLFDVMNWTAVRKQIPASSLIAPRIEAELAFTLKADITKRRFDRTQLVTAIGSVCAAVEIVDSAIADWDIDIVDTIADNASSGAFVTGAWLPFSPSLDLASRKLRMTRDGEEISKGSGAATLGDPVNALAWLAETAVAFDDPLRAGEIVLAGALGPMVPLGPGNYVVEIDGFDPLCVVAGA